MLKHQDIIEKLTTEQKLDLIVDVTALGGLSLGEEMDFKFVKATSLKGKEGWLEYPSFAGLVNSWDVNLIGRVADDVLSRSKKEGTTLVELPDAGFKISPYSEGASEDPLLAGILAKEIALSGNRNGVATCLKDPWTKTADGDYMDKEYSPRMQKEFFGLPYELIASTKVKALKLSKLEEEWQYSQGNDSILQSFKDGAIVINNGGEKGEFVKQAVNEGKFFVNGCREALEEAIENYEKLMKSFDACEIGLADVNRACDSGMALSPEMIDNAVDRILCFAETCSSVPKTEVKKTAQVVNGNKKATKSLAVIAGEDSIVMLKNKNDALPLKTRQKVCVIGRLADGQGGVKDFLLAQANAKKIAFGGYYPGYGDETDINAEILHQAELLAQKCSVVLLAVGFDEKQSQKARDNRNMRLPANQEALVDRLCKLNKKVILLVYGDNPIDMAFDTNANGVLLIPSGGSAVSEATFNVLYGKGCPGGRLANSLYENTDKIFKGIKRYKDSGRNEIGVFHGYRLYTSLNQKVKYPFGFGLSYTKFRYSNLNVRNGIVTLTVKNKGHKEGSELVQFYVSKLRPTSMRPERELKAFFKLRLRPGESQTVRFKISDLKLNIYSEDKKKSVLETGEYVMSACSNASTVVLKHKFTVIGESTNDKPFVKSRYLQTVSNIKDGKYYLEEPAPAPKFAYERTRRFAVGLSYLMIFLASIYLYLYYTNWVSGGLLEFSLVGGLTGAPIILAMAMKSRKNNIIKNHIAKNKIMKKEKRSKLDFDLLCEEIPYEQLFVEEFETSVLDIDKEDEVVVEQVKDEAFINEVFNPEFTMPKAVEQLTAYMKERGIYVDVDSIRSLFASFASSRLLVLNADDKQLLSRFIDLLGKYFSCEKVGVDFTILREQGGDVINTVDDITPIAKALINNGDYRDSIRIMSIDNIGSEEVKSCLQQVIRYIEQPEKEVLFSVLNDGQSYPISNNVWFVLTLGEEQKAVDIPKYILESASVLDLMMRPVEEEPKKKKRGAKKEDAEEVETVTAQSEDSTQAVATEFTEEMAEQEVVVNEGASEIVVEEVVEEEQVDENEDKTPVEVMTYYQFVKMIDVARRKCVLDETLWKRLDKLEDFIISVDGTYRINNKMWQRIEKYVSVYLSAGGSNEEAIDNVVAYHVINTMIPSVANGKNKENVKFANVLENVFGEGHVPHSIKAIKATGLKI